MLGMAALHWHSTALCIQEEITTPLQAYPLWKQSKRKQGLTKAVSSTHPQGCGCMSICMPLCLLACV